MNEMAMLHKSSCLIPSIVCQCATISALELQMLGQEPVSKRDERPHLEDVDQRQRNIVFPDTVSNETRFWRNLYTGKQKLTVIQVFGVIVLAIWVMILAGLPFLMDRDVNSGWEGYLSVLIEWLLAFGLLGGFLLAFRFSELRSRKDKTNAYRTPRKHDS